MELYILSNTDLSTLAILECSSYEINLDNQFTDKSTFRVNKTDGQIKDNFLVVNGLYQQFLFIIDEVEATDKEEKFVNLICSDISNVFNRKIIQKDTNLMTSRSIEYFLAHMIDENFINSDDSFLNKSYVEVTYYESTQAKEATNAENGIYNFHTFMENCREHHNVFTDFKFEDNKLKVTIKHKEDTPVIIDTTLPEVTNYNKIYEQDITAKVQVYIRENDTIQNYYLKTDRTITTNKNDPNRASGAIEVISVETEDDALQEATNVFRGNTYKHLVEFSMSKNSKLVDTTQLYICRAITIKTPDGIYDSIISGISLDDDNFINFKSGNIRINFLDKLKQEQENYGNKLDVTGGTIKGNLTTQGNQTTTGNTTIGKNDGTTSFQINGGWGSNIYWRENGFGDKFRIIPDFNDIDDNNKLKIQGAVGGQETDPDLYDLMTISGKNGNVWFKGDINYFGRTFQTLTLPESQGTVGYRKLCSFTTTIWTNCRLTLLVQSRNQGNGIVTIALSIGSSPTSLYGYPQVKYYGTQTQMHSSWFICFNYSTGLISVYWHHQDYSETKIIVLCNQGFPSLTVGNLISSIPSEAGKVFPMTYDYGVFSQNEYAVGSWIDGHPIYRKVVFVDTVAAGAIKQIDGVVSNLRNVVSIRGSAYNSSFNQSYGIPNTHNDSAAYYINALLAGNNLQVRAGNGFTGGLSKVYVIIEYTKSTD